MKIKDVPLGRKKKYSVLLHLVFLALALIGVSIMYFNPHYGEGVRWLATETYEDTPVFSAQLQTDISDIFKFINYKNVFETNGKLDFSKPMVKVTDAPGETKIYTLAQIIRHAKSLGLYLDENFKISGPATPVNSDTDNTVRVEERYYDPYAKYNEPGDYLTSLDQLSREILTHLGHYYSFYYKFFQNPTNLQFRILYRKNAGYQTLYTNVTPASANIYNAMEDYTNASDTCDVFKALGKFICVRGESVIVESNLKDAPKNITSLLEANNPYNNNNYYMIAVVNTSYPNQDAYSMGAASYNRERTLYIMGIILLSLGALGCIITLYYLVLVSGLKEPGNREIYLHGFDKASTEVFLALCLVAGVCSLFLGEKAGFRLIHLFIGQEKWYYAENLLQMVIVYVVCLTGAFSLLRRYKARTLWDNSLMKKIAVNTALYFHHHNFTARVAICYILYLLFNVVTIGSIMFLVLNDLDILVKVVLAILALIFLGGNLWTFHQLYKNALQSDLINDAVLKISKGDTAYKINTIGFFGKEKDLAENINHIGTGLEKALGEQVKSERLKTDLITNVSHDIKTPLTSIITYVDLIKRENIQDKKIQGYLDVLEQKSQRLKTLTEDLVEASKASSGNLKLEFSSIDFVELIQQTNGEFEEKFRHRSLYLVSSLPDQVVLIEADGRHLWRVLENLYNNAAKYAMEHSRVYVDIRLEAGNVVFTIKNISENPLNITAGELTERFVRGDVARTTEGSGLGLSIAKSLTELQKGSFEIYIDGDLFKVQVAFRIKNGA